MPSLAPSALLAAWQRRFPQSHGGRRWRAILESIASSMADRVVTGVCALAQVPLAVGYLGKEAFGLWMTLSLVVGSMAVADLGLSLGLQNRMADAFGRDCIPEARQAWKTVTLLLAGIAAALAMLSLPLCWLVDWGALFKISDTALAASVPMSIAVLVGTFCLGLPFTTAHRLALAMQLGWMANLKSTVQALVTLGLVALAAWLRLDLPAFLLVIALPPAVANALLLVAVRRQLGWHRSVGLPFSASLGREIMGRNLLFIVPQLGATALSVVPALLVSNQLGAAAMTPWNLMQRLLGLPPQVQQMFLAPLWPAYTEATARGDHAWVRATYRRSLWLSLLVAVLPMLAFIGFGRVVLSWWSGEDIALFDQQLLAAACVWAAVQAFSFPIASVLNAHGWITGQATYGTVSVLLGLGLMPEAIRQYGAAGAPLSLLLSFALISLPLALWEAQHRLRQRARALDAPAL